MHIAFSFDGNARERAPSETPPHCGPQAADPAAGLLLDNGAGPLTLFVPTNEAIAVAAKQLNLSYAALLQTNGGKLAQVFPLYHLSLMKKDTIFYF